MVAALIAASATGLTQRNGEELVVCEDGLKPMAVTRRVCDSRKPAFEAERSQPGRRTAELRAKADEARKEVERLYALPVTAEVLRDLGSARDRLRIAEEDLANQEAIAATVRQEREAEARERRSAAAVAQRRRAEQRAEEKWVSSNPDKDQKWLRSRAGQIWRRHPDWSEEICNVVAARKIQIGMRREMAREAWGRPERINETYVRGHLSEQWVYAANNLYFEDGILTSWQSSHR